MRIMVRIAVLMLSMVLLTAGTDLGVSLEQDSGLGKQAPVYYIRSCLHANGVVCVEVQGQPGVDHLVIRATLKRRFLFWWFPVARWTETIQGSSGRLLHQRSLKGAGQYRLHTTYELFWEGDT